ncbi:MAG: histidine kinase N-terminal 7TM domain-containing protein [Candidatus Nanopelagicales bacterium]
MTTLAPPVPALAAVLGTTGLVCLVLAVVVWQGRRFSAAAPALTVLLLATSWWDLAYAATWAAAPAPSVHFWLDLTYVGVLVVPVALLVFAVRFSARDAWLTGPVIAALSVEPVVVGLLLFTDGAHGLFFGPDRSDSVELIRTGGPVFWLNVAYSYLLVLVATVVLVLRFTRAHGVFRRQAATVLVGISVPWLANILLVASSATLAADPTPFAFSISAAAFAFALVRFRLLTVLPVARHAVLDHIPDGVLVLDPQDRVTDANAAAVGMLGLPDPLPSGAPLVQVCAVPGLLFLVSDPVGAGGDVSLSAAPPLVVDVSISPLDDGRGRRIGRVVVLRDVTARRQLEHDLEEQARTDPLTGLANRRAFSERGVRAIERVRRRPTPLSVVILDVDDLKPVNDRFGHAAGDAVLLRVAETLARSCRTVDVVARIGGDEFALLLPGADLTQAWEVVRRIQQELIAPAAGPGEGGQIRVSAGIAALPVGREPTDLEELVRSADRALYEAKRADRGGIRVSSAPRAQPR